MMTTLLGLSILALGLTIAMFATRNMMLGFPSAIFWGILGGFSYQQSSTTWDWQYTLFFSAMGMVIFCLFAAYALRKSDLAGPDADKGEFIDEGGLKSRKTAPKKRGSGNGQPKKKDWGDLEGRDPFAMEDKAEVATASTHKVRERAKKRKEKVRWGEFK